MITVFKLPTISVSQQIYLSKEEIMSKEIDDQTFIDYVEEWLKEKESDIASRWPQKGGWEGWAQSEIFSFIIKKDSTYDILREQNVYKNSRQKADFLLNNSLTVNKKVVIELKCQSFENAKNFGKELTKDKNKLIKDLNPSYSGADLLIVGIYFTDELKDIPEFFQHKVLGKGEVGICWL